MKYIAICGTVGSGKTTMLGKLLDHFGARASFHEERPQDNPFICDYYADSKRWTFHAQVSFLSLYFDDPAWKPENAKTELFFFDRCFLENLVIARYRLDQGDLTQAEFDTLEKLASGIDSLMPQIDKFIYLDCSMPLASAVRMRSTFDRSNSFANSSAMSAISLQSIRWFRNPSTFTILPGKTLPSFKIRSLSSCITNLLNS